MKALGVILLGGLSAQLAWAEASASALWSAKANQTNAQFGQSLGTAGDVNGDGFADIIVGAPQFTRAFFEEGAVFVYYGSKTGLATQASWTAYGGQRYADFGYSVAGAGDVNKDGFDDVVVGAKAYTFRSGEYDVGAVFVYLGSASGLSSNRLWTLEGQVSGCTFGYVVAGAGDVNGDGFADVIVGAPEYRVNGRPRGKAFVFHGSANGFGRAADWTFAGEQPEALFGYVVASAGDVNADGFADVLVAARDQTINGMQAAGEVFVFYGSREGLSRRPDWRFAGPHMMARVGVNCASAGDVNGDGFGDVIVGAFGESRGEEREGAVYVFYGSARGLGRPGWFAEANKNGSGLGYGVSSAGDVNGDGCSDIIIGAPRYRETVGAAGRVFVYHGSPYGLETNFNWTAASEESHAAFGRTVAAAGDVNGDGFGEVIVGAMMDRFHRFHPSGGQVVLFAGSTTGVRPAELPPRIYPIAARRLGPPPPPWWRQTPVWLSAVLVLACAAAGLWHLRTTRRLKQRLRRAEQQRLVDLERLRIAEDLHDHLGSNLTTISLLSEVARRNLASPKQAEAHLQNIASTTGELTRALEEIVWAVNPRKDTLTQLVAYFSAYAEEFLKPTEVRVRLDFPDDLPALALPSEVRHELFLVFKEALTNSVRHAAATEIRIKLRVEPAALSLWIEDDGRGFDAAAPATDRNGLSNMRGRVERLGGSFEIASRMDNGTCIRLAVPLNSAAAAHEST